MNPVDKTIARIQARNKVKPPMTDREIRDKIKNRNQKWVADYLKTHPCVKCGEANILRLEFDHIDRADKEHTIGRIMNRGLDKLKAEVAKCQVLCANCHAEKTHRENKSWRLKFLN